MPGPRYTPLGNRLEFGPHESCKCMKNVKQSTCILTNILYTCLWGNSRSKLITLIQGAGGGGHTCGGPFQVALRRAQRTGEAQRGLQPVPTHRPLVRGTHLQNPPAEVASLQPQPEAGGRQLWAHVFTVIFLRMFYTRQSYLVSSKYLLSSSSP